MLTPDDDIIERVEEFWEQSKDWGWDSIGSELSPLAHDLFDELKAARAELFQVKAKLAELEGQLVLQQSSLGQPPGRYIGDDL
jgi:hypothetical protein